MRIYWFQLEMKNRKIMDNAIRQRCNSEIKNLFKQFNKVKGQLNHTDESERILSLAELDILSNDIGKLLLIKGILDNAPDEETAKIALNQVKDEIKDVDIVKPLLKKSDDEVHKDKEKKAYELVIKAKQKTLKVLSIMDAEIDKKQDIKVRK